ncbi:MAG TPA: hypothetical protein PKO25_06810 [Spirochaetota bacterium]|jgi:hypothetical protein|nr:hypothetical protein [Spirochaetota bacterium]OPZ37916.1 MAG: hypothetical protein BWY96_01409 [Spirochaetes bacterium ADurb.BinA120]HNU91565.1 hypothetical protein [Spirochaetota bacterium]HPO44745.1 hypothetical protein [Spirochaetota bacterium]HPV98192.1 hypothetical protein [Spirochaetota bacterium]
MNGSEVEKTGGRPETLLLTVVPGAIARFFPLFLEGVALETETGKTVREFLCAVLGVDEAYVEGRISTIFLNGRPVDDLDAAIVDDGSVLALSAAMPGLVGAAMRRGGYYAAMRSGISHLPGEGHSGARRGRIRLKLFNMILEEIAPSLLRAGVIVGAEGLSRVIAGLDRDGLIEPGAGSKISSETRIVVVSRNGP